MRKLVLLVIAGVILFSGVAFAAGNSPAPSEGKNETIEFQTRMELTWFETGQSYPDQISGFPEPFDVSKSVEIPFKGKAKLISVNIPDEVAKKAPMLFAYIMKNKDKLPFFFQTEVDHEPTEHYGRLKQILGLELTTFKNVKKTVVLSGTVTGSRTWGDNMPGHYKWTTTFMLNSFRIDSIK